MPSAVWERMQDELAAAARPLPPPLPVLPGERRLEGSLRKGLFRARLTSRFEVKTEAGHVRVPVLDGAASVTEVRLNGKRASLQREGQMYTIGIDAPGAYTVEVSFLWGKEQDRFARRLRLRLPEAGITRVSVLVAEQEIEAHLAAGVFDRQERKSEGTLLTGFISGSGVLDLAWNRRVTHRSAGPVQLAASSYTILTVQESLIQGLAVFDMRLLEGEADRFDFVVPAGVEVIRVEGDPVLQWHSDPKQAELLSVLLRYFVDDSARLAIRFQYPVAPGAPVRLRTPMPRGVETVTGLMGVQAPAGLSVKVVQVKDATELKPHELPAELSDLAASPLVSGFSHGRAPAVDLSVERQKPVELTSTLIDELQASTVVIEDGSEITKVNLRMRNNTKQYLTVTLPAGSLLTHSLIDGRPVRPAVGGEDVLLFPLRQSERIKTGEQHWHVVAHGETLSDLANRYYSDPGKWQQILEANREQLTVASNIEAGQRLRIPAPAGVAVQESSFVVELAYRRAGKSLGAWGRAALTLPKMDVDAMEAVWHLYLPEALSPLSFSSNLAQYSAIRYDPLRRARDLLRKSVQDFLRNPFAAPPAWAGMPSKSGARYENILKQRKDIYAAEASEKAEGRIVLASFPLVGERYRFKRLLLGQEVPAIGVVYATRAATPWVRFLALVAALVLGLLVLRPDRTRRTLAVAAGVGVLLLAVAYYVPGVHRRILWGVDLALGVALLRLRGGALLQACRRGLREPWRMFDRLTLGNLLIAFLAFMILLFVRAMPLLLSCSVGVLLLWSWRRATAPPSAESGLSGQEVTHA